jgi:hypothetical protein
MPVEAFPLTWPDGWPRTNQQSRGWSRFKTGYLAAYDNLTSQLRLLGASNVVISSNAPLRRDGKPYTDAMNDQLVDPGVAVYFRLKGEPRVMARDGHPTPAENLHAIGHVIEALRSIDRHGGSYMMTRAFSAFAALPAPGSARPWREILGFHGVQLPTKQSVDEVWKTLAKKAHPDAGGSDRAMAELNQARSDALKEIG